MTIPRGGSAVTTSMSYRDAPAAIEWLCSVFGFERHAVYAEDDGTIAHAELTLGGGMVMISSLMDGPFRQYVTMPAECGGAVTVSTNLAVDDPDAVYARVQATGVDVLFEIEDKHYGGRGFSCRDPEGHIWNVGSYDPWTPK